jgi:bifunctional non-homologous end joining protein LigD
MPLTRRPEPFSHPDWLFEIKHDGFRALAYIERGAARLLSRNGNWFKSFPVLCDNLASDVNVRSAVLDGEIVCLDKQGHT